MLKISTRLLKHLLGGTLDERAYRYLDCIADSAVRIDHLLKDDPTQSQVQTIDDDSTPLKPAPRAILDVENPALVLIEGGIATAQDCEHRQFTPVLD